MSNKSLKTQNLCEAGAFFLKDGFAGLEEKSSFPIEPAFRQIQSGTYVAQKWRKKSKKYFFH